MRKDDLVIMLLSLVPTLLVTAWVAAADPSLTQWLQLAARAPPTPRDDMTVGEEGCPPCRMIFGKAVPSRYSGRLMQIVEVLRFLGYSCGYTDRRYTWITYVQTLEDPPSFGKE